MSAKKPHNINRNPPTIVRNVEYMNSFAKNRADITNRITPIRLRAFTLRVMNGPCGIERSISIISIIIHSPGVAMQIRNICINVRYPECM